VNSSAPDIRDIHPPYPIPQDWWVLALIGTALVLALLLAWFGWRWLRARHPQLTLVQRTLLKLDATRPLMEGGDARAFSVAVSDIVRGYVEERFNVHATQRTTPEFLRDCLTQVGSVLQAHEQSLSEFLKFCDLAKFARWSLSGGEMQGLLASARHFVESTGVPVATRTDVVTEAVNVPIRQS
jgi:Domain of unknown function (DUF4381)